MSDVNVEILDYISSKVVVLLSKKHQTSYLKIEFKDYCEGFKRKNKYFYCKKENFLACIAFKLYLKSSMSFSCFPKTEEEHTKAFEKLLKEGKNIKCIPPGTSYREFVSFYLAGIAHAKQFRRENDEDCDDSFSISTDDLEEDGSIWDEHRKLVNNFVVKLYQDCWNIMDWGSYFNVI